MLTGTVAEPILANCVNHTVNRGPLMTTHASAYSAAAVALVTGALLLATLGLVVNAMNIATRGPIQIVSISP
jgi:hypothetical protein